LTPYHFVASPPGTTSKLVQSGSLYRVDERFNRTVNFGSDTTPYYLPALMFVFFLCYILSGPVTYLVTWPRRRLERAVHKGHEAVVSGGKKP